MERKTIIEALISKLQYQGAHKSPKQIKRLEEICKIQEENPESNILETIDLLEKAKFSIIFGISKLKITVIKNFNSLDIDKSKKIIEKLETIGYIGTGSSFRDADNLYDLLKVPGKIEGAIELLDYAGFELKETSVYYQGTLKERDIKTIGSFRNIEDTGQATLVIRDLFDMGFKRLGRNYREASKLAKILNLSPINKLKETTSFLVDAKYQLGGTFFTSKGYIARKDVKLITALVEEKADVKSPYQGIPQI